MTNSPLVKFNLENNNVEVSTPQTGISHVMAKLTKGPINDPSTVVNNLTQFYSLFGKEIVPDGSISNIEAALKQGSRLRIARLGGTDPKYGNAIVGVPSVEVGSEGILVPSEVTPGHNSIPLVIRTTKGYLFFNIKSKGMGDNLPSNPTLPDSPNFGIKISQQMYGSNTAYDELIISAYSTMDSTKFDDSHRLYQESIATFSNIYGYFDAIKFKSWIDLNIYFNVEFLYARQDVTLASPLVEDITSMDDAIQVLNNSANNVPNPIYKSGGVALAKGDSYYVIGDIGTAGGTITIDSWKAAYDSLKDYEDAYQVVASHVHQHLTVEDATALHKYIKEDQDISAEAVYYIEVPKIDATTGAVMVDEDIINWVESMIEAIGNSQYVAYFAGGWKYYNQSGTLVNCDTLGTVLGLGDTSASKYGPWLHFSGQNRGLVLSARGIVAPNYGSPSNYAKLNAIANARVNMAVIRETPSYGKQPMLVHNFTSSLRTDSFRYLGVVRLCLYIKKSFRPILNNFLEEPNTFSTWKRMYYKVNDIIEALVAANAITDPVYTGDQDATSYKDLVYNTEADVRQGKYKVKFTFKDVVALQEITFNLVIDSSNGSASVEVQ